MEQTKAQLAEAIGVSEDDLQGALDDLVAGGLADDAPRLQTFAKKSEKFGYVRDPDGTNVRPITLRSYKDKRAAKNRVARKQRKTNRK